MGMSMFIEPCLPTISRTVPTWRQWAYEIKHDGLRFLAVRVRVYSGNAWIAVGNTARKTWRESFFSKTGEDARVTCTPAASKSEMRTEILSLFLLTRLR